MPSDENIRAVEVIARALLLDGDRVLLCRSVAGGYFYLPGGHVETNELASEACARELLEEAGISGTIGECELVCEVLFGDAIAGNSGHEINMVFRVEQARIADGEKLSAGRGVVSNESHITFEWVEIAAIPSIDLRPTVISAWLLSGGQSAPTDRADWLSGREK